MVDGRTVYIEDYTVDVQLLLHRAYRAFPPMEGSCMNVAGSSNYYGHALQFTNLLPAYTPPSTSKRNLALEGEPPASRPPATWASSLPWSSCSSLPAFSAWFCFATAPPQQRREPSPAHPAPRDPRRPRCRADLPAASLLGAVCSLVGAGRCGQASMKAVTHAVHARLIRDFGLVRSHLITT